MKIQRISHPRAGRTGGLPVGHAPYYIPAFAVSRCVWHAEKALICPNYLVGCARRAPPSEHTSNDRGTTPRVPGRGWTAVSATESCRRRTLPRFRRRTGPAAQSSVRSWSIFYPWRFIYAIPHLRRCLISAL